MLYEDWQTKYEEILEEYKQQKQLTIELQQNLSENQMRYIKREQEYRDVENKLLDNIQKNSTHPLQLLEDKTEDQYLIEGIDPQDKEQKILIERRRKQQEENMKAIEGGNTAKNIKDIHFNLKELGVEIERAQHLLEFNLKAERKAIFEKLQGNFNELKKKFDEEAKKKQDNQYDYKQKEKELTEHLETMTLVA